MHGLHSNHSKKVLLVKTEQRNKIKDCSRLINKLYHVCPFAVKSFTHFGGQLCSELHPAGCSSLSRYPCGSFTQIGQQILTRSQYL